MEQDDKTLVDEFERLQNTKKEIDKKIDEIREMLIAFAKQKNTEILFGTHKKCSIKEYEKVVYPASKEKIIELIKSKGLYDRFSSINYFKLSPKILKGEIDKEIIDLVRKEKAFRISLIDRGV